MKTECSKGFVAVAVFQKGKSPLYKSDLLFSNWKHLGCIMHEIGC